jgi:hypothetical protein
MSALDMLLRAEVSSDLTHRDRFSDVDVLGAAGMAAANQFIHTCLYRIKYLYDLSEADAAKRIFIRWTRVSMVNRKISPAGASRVGVQALTSWVDDICDACGGHGYMPMPGAPALSDRPCPACSSTGKRKPKAKGAELDVLRDVHGRADAAVRMVEVGLDFKMGRD